MGQAGTSCILLFLLLLLLLLHLLLLLLLLLPHPSSSPLHPTKSAQKENDVSKASSDGMEDVLQSWSDAKAQRIVKATSVKTVLSTISVSAQ
jgi:hypothetical protein